MSGVTPGFERRTYRVAASPDTAIREAMFRHLDALRVRNPSEILASADINTFTFEDRLIRLVVQQGICKPAGLDAALTIRTAYTPPTGSRPYEDVLGHDGLVRYKYQGEDPDQWDNRSLRVAMADGAALAYFVGIAPGRYVAQYPVWVRGEDAGRHEFAIAVDEAQRFIDLSAVDDAQRAYVERLTRSRLHQPLFRARVLREYREQCAICRLRHAELLDAAHIIPDTQPRGEPIVPNGLALCKIHHAAFDRNLLGIRPDLVVEVAENVLREVDGPMLRHGLQEMAGSKILVPRARVSQPDKERLEVRYEEFRAAS